MMLSCSNCIKPFGLNWKLYIELNLLLVYDDRYIKTKTRTYGDKVYTSFGVLNVAEDGVEYIWCTIISIDSLLVYENKFYLQVYLDNCAYKVVNKQMILMAIFWSLMKINLINDVLARSV